MDASGAVEIIQRLREISGGKILDVGTEQGGFISTLMKSLKDYKSFIGIDISEEDLKKARSKFTDKPVEFKIMNAEAIEYPDDSFDTICISYSIHHLSNPKQVFTEIKRVLKLGGYLLLQECFCDGDQSEPKQTDILIHHWNAKLDTLRGTPHFETLSQKKLRNLVSSMNFESIEAFESRRYIKCLFCEDMEKCEDAKNQDIIDYQIKEIDDLLEKMVDSPQYEELCQEADSLKKRVRATGVMPASFLFFICRK